MGEAGGVRIVEAVGGVIAEGRVDLDAGKRLHDSSANDTCPHFVLLVRDVDPTV